jgi:hypothetical protein
MCPLLSAEEYNPTPQPVHGHQPSPNCRICQIFRDDLRQPSDMGLHLRQLRTKCQRILNILRISTGTSWGADRTVMLRLYRCLIRSRLDYGSFIYASASKNILSIIDPIQHCGIRFSTGAFRTSRVESLYTESGEPALVTRRQILLCNYAVKLSALKEYPSYGAIHGPSLQRRFALNTKASRPAGIRYKELLAALHITPPPINHLKIPRTPPWDILRSYCDTRLCVLPKACTSPGTYRRLFQQCSHTTQVT